MIKRLPVESPVTEYLHAKAARLGIPLSGSFELTPLCNLQCRMCYVRMTRAQQEAVRPLRTAEEWLSLGRQAREAGLLYLLLTGGEPFSHPEFPKILAGLHAMGLLISINSNGTLIDEETVAWLKKTPPVRVNMTLYGASNDTYGRLCGLANGFDRAVEAIHLLTKADIPVKLNCSLTPYNCGDLEEMFAFARREGLPIQASSYMFPPVRRDPGQVGRNARFSPEEAAYFAARIEALNNEAAFLMRAAEEQAHFLNLEDVPCAAADGPGEGMRCRAGKCSFWVTWEGKLLPCGMFPGGTDVFQCGFARSWERAKEEAAAIRLSAACKSCVLRTQCRNCAAMAFTECGDYQGVPEYRCRMARAYPDAVRRVQAEIQAKADKEKTV